MRADDEKQEINLVWAKYSWVAVGMEGNVAIHICVGLLSLFILCYVHCPKDSLTSIDLYVAMSLYSIINPCARTRLYNYRVWRCHQ